MLLRNELLCLDDPNWAGILNDVQIGHLCVSKDMIKPYYPIAVKKDKAGNPVISYGQSSFGYDIRLASEFKLFDKPRDGRVIDSKNFIEDEFLTRYEGESIVVPPGALLLAKTVEYFKIPRNVVTVCVGKSTLARLGVMVNVTPLEPEWEGQLVVEITNGTSFPIRIYANEGVAQLLFHWNGNGCGTSYADKGGKYQGQTGVTTSLL